MIDCERISKWEFFAIEKFKPKNFVEFFSFFLGVFFMDKNFLIKNTKIQRGKSLFQNLSGKNWEIWKHFSKSWQFRTLFQCEESITKFNTVFFIDSLSQFSWREITAKISRNFWLHSSFFSCCPNLFSTLVRFSYETAMYNFPNL